MLLLILLIITTQMAFAQPQPDELLKCGEMLTSDLKQDYIEVNVSAQDPDKDVRRISIYLYQLDPTSGLINFKEVQETTGQEIEYFFHNFTGLDKGLYLAIAEAEDSKGNVDATKIGAFNIAGTTSCPNPANWNLLCFRVGSGNGIFDGKTCNLEGQTCFSVDKACSIRFIPPTPPNRAEVIGDSITAVLEIDYDSDYYNPKIILKDNEGKEVAATEINQDLLEQMGEGKIRLEVEGLEPGRYIIIGLVNFISRYEFKELAMREFFLNKESKPMFVETKLACPGNNFYIALKDELGNPIEGAEIEATSYDGEGNSKDFSLITNSEGKATIELPYPVLDITIFKEGYSPYTDYFEVGLCGEEQTCALGLKPCAECGSCIKEGESCPPSGGCPTACPGGLEPNEDGKCPTICPDGSPIPSEGECPKQTLTAQIIQPKPGVIISPGEELEVATLASSSESIKSFKLSLAKDGQETSLLDVNPQSKEYGRSLSISSSQTQETGKYTLTLEVESESGNKASDTSFFVVSKDRDISIATEELCPENKLRVFLESLSGRDLTGSSVEVYFGKELELSRQYASPFEVDMPEEETTYTIVAESEDSLATAKGSFIPCKLRCPKGTEYCQACDGLDGFSACIPEGEECSVDNCIPLSSYYIRASTTCPDGIAKTRVFSLFSSVDSLPIKVSGPTNAQGKTDATGSFSFSVEESGTYTIEIVGEDAKKDVFLKSCSDVIKECAQETLENACKEGDQFCSAMSACLSENNPTTCLVSSYNTNCQEPSESCDAFRECLVSNGWVLSGGALNPPKQTNLITEEQQAQICLAVALILLAGGAYFYQKYYA